MLYDMYYKAKICIIENDDMITTIATTHIIICLYTYYYSHYIH
jgi:hypothetical protein